ncbi:MAG: hypothetical protein ACD_75C00497G0002, partial [uncultured bacterium]
PGESLFPGRFFLARRRNRAFGKQNLPHSRNLIDDGIADYDDIPPWYKGNDEIAARNTRLKKRRQKGSGKRESPDADS